MSFFCVRTYHGLSHYLLWADEGENVLLWTRPAEMWARAVAANYGDNHWKWHVSGGPVLGANETREFIIGSLGATRKGGGRNGNNTRVASTVRCNQGELS